MVSNQEKVMIISKKKRCKPRKIKVCKKSQKISTHLLTWLIIGAIVQIEQRKRDKRNKEKFRRSQNQMLNENNTSVTPNVQTIKTITERSNDL